jgi:hypothetical protein
MSDKELDNALERIEDLENEMRAVKELPMSLARLEGKVDGMSSTMVKRFDGTDGKVDGVAKAHKGINWPSLLATLITVAVGVGTPIAVALIGSH